MKEAPTLRIRIVHGGAMIAGPGRADLLEHIHATGSIAAAGRAMGMSYKRAWALVEVMNKTFALPLVETTKGGAGGGGAKLTELGGDVLAAYREIEAAAQRSARRLLARLGAAIAVPPGAESG